MFVLRVVHFTWIRGCYNETDIQDPSSGKVGLLKALSAAGEPSVPLASAPSCVAMLFMVIWTPSQTQPSEWLEIAPWNWRASCMTSGEEAESK